LVERRFALRPPDVALKSATLVAALVLMCVSGGMLWLVGYNYDGLAGSPAAKLHPFTYFIFVALVWRASQSGAPLAWLEAKLTRRPATCWLLMMTALLVVTTVLRSGPGMAGFIDTFAAPAAFALLLDDYTSDDLKPLTWALHAAMTANALLGLIEFATSRLYFPYRLDGVAHLEDTRSTALQGHPLMNAALTSIYVVSLMAGAKALPGALRAGMLGLQFAALVVFGGRTGIVVSLAMAPLFAIQAGFATLRRGRLSLLGAAAGAAAIPLVGVAVISLLASGLADRLLMRFADDSGSAATRVIMFDMLRPFSWGELALGPDIEYVETLRRHFGLEQGVENPFVRMILYQGGIAMAAAFLSLIWFFRELLRGRGLRVIGPVVAMAVLLNASESVAVKTDFLDKLVLIFVCLLPPLAQRKPSAATMSGSSARVRSSIRPMPSNRHQNAQGKPNASALSRTSRI
jgi:hypothetical protein